MKTKFSMATLLIILAVINGLIYQHEQHLNRGETLYLQLAPVDPRSLMQGDYMALRFRARDDLSKALTRSDDHDGQIVMHLDSQRIATFKEIYQGKAPVPENEIIINYHLRNNKIKIASNAFFFQEGSAQHFQKARYGEFKVDSAGKLLLSALYDAKLELISTPQ